MVSSLQTFQDLNLIKGMAGIHEREGFPSSPNLKIPFVEEYFEGLISLWPMG